MMKRVPKSICKKDKSPNEDDDNEGTASNGIPQQDSDLRELESKRIEDGHYFFSLSRFFQTVGSSFYIEIQFGWEKAN